MNRPGYRIRLREPLRDASVALLTYNISESSDPATPA
jgi:hypothetical protein